MDAGGFDAREVEESRGVQFDENYEVRRVRLEARGEPVQDWAWRAQLELSNQEISLHDGWVEYRGLPLGGVRVGRQRQPQSLEAHTSSKAVPLMERAAPVSALTAGRDSGVMLHDRWGPGTWSVGVFSPADAIDSDVHADTLEAGGRLTWLPWRDEGSGRLVHLGASVGTRESHSGVLRFDARPDAHLAPELVDTGDIPTDGATQAGVEALWIGGPWSLQAEWLGVQLETAGEDALLQGANLLGTYTLTGEPRPYQASRARLTRLIPRGEAHGAWELVTRLSRTDLSDGPVEGGEMDLASLGVNWYASEELRVMGNWVHTRLEDGSEADLFLVRLQIDF